MTSRPQSALELDGIAFPREACCRNEWTIVIHSPLSGEFDNRRGPVFKFLTISCWTLIPLVTALPKSTVAFAQDAGPAAQPAVQLLVRNESTIDILLNQEVVVVDQDAPGQQARRVRDDGNAEVWSRPLSDGARAVVLLHRGIAPTTEDLKLLIIKSGNNNDMWQSLLIFPNLQLLHWNFELCK